MIDGRTLKRAAFFALLAFLLLSNAMLLLWQRSTRKVLPKARLQNSSADFRSTDRRHAILKDWYSKPSVPVERNKLEDALQNVFTHECVLAAPHGCVVVPADELSNTQRRDLVTAIVELLVSYGDGSPEAVIAYMHERGEQLVPKMMKNKWRYYRDTHMGVADARRPSDEDVWAHYWRDWKYGAEWAGIVADATSATIARCPAKRVALLRSAGSLATDRFPIWMNKTTFPHHFAPHGVRNTVYTLKENDTVLIADVRLVVVHSLKLFGQRSPYYVRYWCDSTTSKWHPLLLVRSQIDQGRQDGVKILF